MLARHPQMGELRPDLRDDLRSFSVGNYVVFFRQQMDFVEIVRVIHGARDASAVFGRRSK